MAASRAKRMPQKKSSTANRKAMTWHEKGAALLDQYLKSAKASSGQVLVLTAYGDTVLRSSSKKDLDWVSIGSITASVQSAADGLRQLLSLKTCPIQFGTSPSGFWIESLNHWLILGIRCPYQSKFLKPLMAHLKTGSEKQRGGEALDGMTADSIEASLTREMDQ